MMSLVVRKGNVHELQSLQLLLVLWVLRLVDSAPETSVIGADAKRRMSLLVSTSRLEACKSVEQKTFFTVGSVFDDNDPVHTFVS